MTPTFLKMILSYGAARKKYKLSGQFLYVITAGIYTFTRPCALIS
jgi:hypothetical protein